MNGPFKVASAAMLITECINAADAIPVSVHPLETPMLILLVITAVAVSLAAEFLYAYIVESRDGTWVRSDVQEHHEIVRVMGRVSFKPIREVE
jgi:hypothetical protein